MKGKSEDGMNLQDGSIFVVVVGFFFSSQKWANESGVKADTLVTHGADVTRLSKQHVASSITVTVSPPSTVSMSGDGLPKAVSSSLSPRQTLSYYIVRLMISVFHPIPSECWTESE